MEIQVVNQTYNSYYNDRGEIFARFFARFIEWTDNIATGNKYYSYESTMYGDKFTQAQYVEFARLLQEKALLDGKKYLYDVVTIKENTSVSVELSERESIPAQEQVQKESASNDIVAQDTKFVKSDSQNSPKLSDRDSLGNELSEEQVEFFKDSKVRDKKGNLSDIRYDDRSSSNDLLTEYSVQAALYDSLDHADKGDDNLIRISSMPKYIVDLIGIDGDFYLYRNHSYENMVSAEQAKEDGRFDAKAHYHNLGVETMTDAVMSLEHPLMTMSTKSKEGNPTVIMLLPVFGKNNAPLYSVLSFYANKPINGDLTRKPHIVLTIHERNYFEDGGRAGISDIVKSAVSDGRVLDFDKKRGKDLSVIAKSAGLGNITEASLKESVAQFRKFVNSFREENKISCSDRDTTSVSNRSLLAGALESVAQNDIEKNKLEQYKAKIAQIESEQKKLTEIRAKANRLRFTKGRTAEETKQMHDLDAEATKIANRISTYDKQLLGLEARGLLYI